MAANSAKLTCQFCGAQNNAGNHKRHVLKCEKEHTSMTPNGREITQLSDVETDDDNVDLLFEEIEEEEVEGEEAPGWQNLGPIQALAVKQQSDSPLSLPGFVTETSLSLPENLTIEEWVDVGHKLETITKATQWWWGDYLKYGERKWGESYSQALDASGLKIQTLYNAAWVSGTFDASRRRENLTFGHHDAVATKKLKPEEQDKLLDVAASTNLSVKELRAVVKTVLITDVKAEPEPKATLQCVCHCHAAVCMECHKPVGPHPSQSEGEQ
jgi:hypothetical protein